MRCGRSSPQSSMAWRTSSVTPPPPARAHTVPHTRSRRRRGSGSIVVLHVLRAPSSMLDSECIVRQTCCIRIGCSESDCGGIDGNHAEESKEL